MGGRLALVIGSECAEFRKLGFVQERAGDLYDTLTDLGDWEAAGGLTGPVINPSTASLSEAVRNAFAEASSRQATLLFAFIGHGQADGDQDYFLFAADSTQPPTVRSAFHLIQEIRDNLKTAATLDGLICLTDACEAGEGVRGAGQRWLQPLVASGGRMELMVASGDTDAYDGCFTRTLVATARRGDPKAGEYLLCADLKPSLSVGCPRQTPVLLSFDGVTVVPDDTADRGLYLVANIVRRGSDLVGTAAVGLVDQLTRGVVITGAVAEAYQRLREADGERLRAVVGPAGAGKSTLVSLLLRPELVVDDSTRIAVHAAVFLDASSTRGTVANSLSDQLAKSVPGFAGAVAAVESGTDPEELNALDALEARVRRPLEQCRQAGTRVRILIDGLDQPGAHSRERILDAVATLADPSDGRLGHLRVIVTARQTVGLTGHPGLGGAHLVVLEGPTPEDLSAVVQRTRGRRDLAIEDDLLANLPADGGWLIARLLAEVEERFLPRQQLTLESLVTARLRQASTGPTDAGPMAALLSVLTAAGAGAVLPVAVLSHTVERLGHQSTVPGLRDLLVRLGALTARSRPGRPEERAGLAHPVLVALLDRRSGGPVAAEALDVASAHVALAWVISKHLSDTGLTLVASDTTWSGPLDFGDEATVTVPAMAPEYVTAHQYVTHAGPRHHVQTGDVDGAVAVLTALDGSRAADNRDRWAAWLTEIGRAHV